MPAFRRSRNSSCPAGRVRRASRMSREPYAAAPSAHWCNWQRPSGVNDPSRKYLNRLSDLLFVLARMLNREAGRGDVLWRKDRERS